MGRQGIWHWEMMERWVGTRSVGSVRVWALFIVIYSLEKFEEDCNVIGFQCQVPPSYCKSKPRCTYSKEYSTGVHAFGEVCVCTWNGFVSAFTPYIFNSFSVAVTCIMIDGVECPFMY